MSYSAAFPENHSQQPENFQSYVLRKKFARLFPHGWDFIVKETPDAPWKTIKNYHLTEAKLWYKYLDPDQILGVRFGTTTQHGLCDLDTGSCYDPRIDESSLDALKTELEAWGIVRVFFVQSSFSEGLHLYAFFSREVNSFRLACVLRKAAENAGLNIKRGQLETFPNTKQYDRLFNGHRLPLQEGSFLLSDDFQPESDAVEDFIAAAEWSAAGNDVDLLESRLEEAYEWFKATKNQERVIEPTPEEKDFCEQVEYAQRDIKEGFLGSIRFAIEEGFTGVGETNELLLTIAKLGRILHGLSGDAYVTYIKDTITACPGYTQYCRHRHEIHRRCVEVARYGEKQWYPYRTRLPKDRPSYQSIKSALTIQSNRNDERAANARSRIEQAVAYILSEHGELPARVGESKLAIRNVTKELFGISVSDATLKKPENLPLWHPAYREKPQQNSEGAGESHLPDVPTPNEETHPEGDRAADPDPAPVVPLNPPPVAEQKRWATPLPEDGQSEEESDPLKPLSDGDFPILGYTLPYMKGMAGSLLLSLLCQIWERAYCVWVMNTPGVVFEYQGYRCNSVTGLVERKGETRSRLQVIHSGTEVFVMPDQIHSSFYRKNPNQFLVYIMPLTLESDWLDGIAVPVRQLIPLRFRSQRE